MTHDELLYGIKEIERLAEGMWGTKALRAVVELHKPEKIPTWVPTSEKLACPICPGFYPCQTIQAIEEAFSIGNV